MVIKEFDIVLDLKRTKQLNVIEVVQGDYETNIFNIQIEDNYIPVNLTGTTIEVMFAKPDNTSVMQDNVEIIDSATGKIKLVLNTNTIAAYGKVLAEVRIKESGKVVTTAQFNFLVRRAIVSNVVSTNEYPVLERIIRDATEAQDKYEEMVKRSFVILKPPVATAADIPTTYPNPENGWTTRAQDTGNMYRHNRYTDSWELIDNIPSTAYDALLNEFRPAIENLQTDFSSHLLENVAVVRYFNRDLSVTGIQTISTAVAKIPKLIIVFGVVNGTHKTSICIGMNSITATDSATYRLMADQLAFSDDGNNRTVGKIQNIQKGSFDINWTHLGAGATGDMQANVALFYHGGE